MEKLSTALLLRLSPHEPYDLDSLLAPHDRRSPPVGKDIAPCVNAETLPPCRLARPDKVVVATRVRRPLDDPTDTAFRLAALAIQHDVEIVVFSDIDYSGLERFGFRTERVVGRTDPERELCLTQLRHFWGVELVL